MMVRRFPSVTTAIIGAALILGAAPFCGAAAGQLPASHGAPLRDLTTDRPDTTESPFTIDKGHVQVEATLLGFSRDRRDVAGNAAESFEVATTNVRIGLTRALELDIAVRPYGTVAPGGGAARSDGPGAVDIRAKLNLWGNDGGTTALALLPFASIPVDPANAISPPDIEYGLLIPLAIDLGHGLSLGLNAGVDVRRDDPVSPYRAFGIATASLAVALSDRVGSYYEIAVEAGGDREAATSLNTGITWLARDTLQLDAGTQFGVSGDAPVFAPFVGFSIRF